MDYQAAIDHILVRLEQELAPELKYHALIHTVSVMRNCKKIAKAEGIKSPELELLLTAAAYHDAGFLYVYEKNEPIGCQIAEKALPKYGYSSAQINQIKGMIMATQTPQNPQNLLEMILCDADLYYLGGDQYDQIADSLYEELNLYQQDLTKSDWRAKQISSLEKHRYFTDFAKNTRGPKKQQTLARLKKESTAI